MKTICVDLDGTLLATDCLWEAALERVRRNPLAVFGMLRRALGRRLAFKTWMAEASDLNVETLPTNAAVVSYCEAAARDGHRLVLVSASPESWVRAAQARFPFFHESLGSTGENLKAQAKADALVRRFGERGFDYVGNSFDDIPVWRVARGAFAVNPGRRLRAAARRANGELEVWVDRAPKLRTLVRAVRVHQWAKNALVFAPLVLAHQLFHVDLIGRAALAFASLSLTASSGYVMNDLLDLASDRAHHRKRFRPFAAGGLSIPFGLILAPTLMIAGLGLASVLSWPFFALVVGYWVATTSYSFFLKRLALVDFTVLASLYTLRVFAGALATGVSITDWFIVFSVFFFSSLALVKRYSELWRARQAERETIPGRGYQPSDLEFIGQFGVGFGLLALLIFSFYIQSNVVTVLYARPHVLWGMMPILMLWIARVWLFAYRGDMNEDPIVFALKDRASWWMLLGLIIVGGMAV